MRMTNHDRRTAGARVAGVAMAHACGHGTRRDLKAAVPWLRKAADQGHVQAKSVLGWMHMTGKDAGRDRTARPTDAVPRPRT